MRKSKRFTFIAVILVGILLVVGKWTTPVQANNAGIIGTTPTPTGTPVEEPDNPGETPSIEQQEQLKSVIQSYFEICYRALSISQPDDFKLNGFGSLMSDEADAKAPLNAELGKLAVEIKHAELNHLRYMDYKYLLDFRNITVDTYTQMTTVSVVEEIEII